MTTGSTTVVDELEQRVTALENGSNSWAALVGEDVRAMRRDLEELRALVEELRAGRA